MFLLRIELDKLSYTIIRLILTSFTVSMFYFEQVNVGLCVCVCVCVVCVVSVYVRARVRVRVYTL